MITKDGVELPWNDYMWPALFAADFWGDTITSGNEGHRNDGVHSKRSLHYDSLAIDVRYAPGFRRVQRAGYEMLGYTVLSEKDHLHISFDPNGRRK